MIDCAQFSWKMSILTVWCCVSAQAGTCFLGISRGFLVFSGPGVRYTHIFWKCCCILFHLCVILALLSSVPAGSPVQIIPQSIRTPPSEMSKKVPPPTPPKPRRASQYGPLGCSTCLRKLSYFAALHPLFLLFFPDHPWPFLSFLVLPWPCLSLPVLVFPFNLSGVSILTLQPDTPTFPLAFFGMFQCLANCNSKALHTACSRVGLECMQDCVCEIRNREMLYLLPVLP